MKDLKTKYGNWALITGASSGIGEEFAKRLAQLRMKLILIARRKERLNKLADELISKCKTEIVIASVDLSSDNFLDEIVKHVGNREVGILINNAGFGSTGEFIHTNPENEADMVKVNCLAPTILTHYFVKQMVERKKGAIIFLGSVVAFQPTPYMATYAATKAFNLFLGEALWWELKKYNIDVLSLNPGGTATEFQRIASSTVGPIPRTAEDVVTSALKALGKKPSVVDGFINKLVSISTRFVPRKLILSATGVIARKLYMQKLKEGG